MMRFLEREGLVSRTDTRLQITSPAGDRVQLEQSGIPYHQGSCLLTLGISPVWEHGSEKHLLLAMPRKRERGTSTSPTTRCRHNRPFTSAGARTWPSIAFPLEGPCRRAVGPRKQPGQGGPNQGGRGTHTQTPGLPTGAPAHGKGVCASTTTPSVAPLSNSSSPPWGTLEIELQGSPFPAWACMTFWTTA